MTTALTLGNGDLLIGYDTFGQIKDFYFPYPGLENHLAKEMVHKIGVYADGRTHWLDDPLWVVTVKAASDTLASDIVAKNNEMGLQLTFTDVVYNEKNIFVREVVVESFFETEREVVVFFNQQFVIAQTISGDTAYFDPRDNTLIHYKGRRVFLINVLKDIASGIDEYSVGLIGIEGREGTFKDAEDGELTKNPIEHGRVDSVVGVRLRLEGTKRKTFYYWITAAKSLSYAKKLNAYVLQKLPQDLVKTTTDYWKAWVNNHKFSFYGLSPEVIELFNRSLLTIRTHVATNGAILASGDSSMLQYGRDTYSYVWPRDGAMTAIALIKAGDFNAAKRFFQFANNTITEGGYFMHKYRPDESLGSSWHPWVWNDRKQLPIQEDETALVLYALWAYFESSKDLEFIESIYNTLIKAAAEFMVNYINSSTGLPEPSYDLWEEKYGIHTFTAATVYAALGKAAQFARVLGKDKFAMKYETAAERMKVGILKHLYDEKRKVFNKMLIYTNGKTAIDPTIDFSSIYGVFKFGVMDSDDKTLSDAMTAFTDTLTLQTSIGGIARFEGDMYHKAYPGIPGNPWLITSLWHTQYKISQLSQDSPVEGIISDLEWIVKHASYAGLLSEQLDPYAGEQRSATPLIWSHAEYVITVLDYLEKLNKLGISDSGGK